MNPSHSAELRQPFKLEDLILEHNPKVTFTVIPSNPHCRVHPYNTKLRLRWKYLQEHYK